MADEVDSLDPAETGGSEFTPEEDGYTEEHDFGELSHLPSDNEDKGQSQIGDKAEDKTKSQEDATKGDQSKDGQKGQEENKDDPRLVELRTQIAQERESRLKAEARFEMLEKQINALKGQSATTKEEEAPRFKDITQLSKEDLIEWQSEDPIGYASNLYEQIRHELNREFAAKEAQKLQESERQKTFATIDSTYKDFESKNADFKPMWESGEIKKFIDSHPGHNAMSAYYAITEANKTSNFQKQQEEAIKKAKEEGKAEALKDLKAKGNASTLGSGPATTHRDTSETDELKDTKKKGGTVSVLTSLLLRDRKALGG